MDVFLRPAYSNTYWDTAGPQMTNVAHIILEGWKTLEASTYVRLVQDFNQARDKDGCRWESLSTSKQYLITYLYRHLRELYLYTK